MTEELKAQRDALLSEQGKVLLVLADALGYAPGRDEPLPTPTHEPVVLMLAREAAGRIKAAEGLAELHREQRDRALRSSW